MVVQRIKRHVVLKPQEIARIEKIVSSGKSEKRELDLIERLLWRVKLIITKRWIVALQLLQECPCKYKATHKVLPYA